MEHSHAIGHAKDLGQFGADQDDAYALRRQLVEQFVDRVFRADVDAARGLVEEQHPRVAKQPLADDDLLLIAARQSCVRSA